MASLTRWMWVWVNSGSRWWTGRPGVLRFMGLQRVGHDWATELNGTDTIINLLSDYIGIAWDVAVPILKVTQALNPEIILIFSASLTSTESYYFYLFNITFLCSILSIPHSYCFSLDLYCCFYGPLKYLLEGPPLHNNFASLNPPLPYQQKIFPNFNSKYIVFLL